MEECVVCGKEFDGGKEFEIGIRWDYEDEPMCNECRDKMDKKTRAWAKKLKGEKE